MKKKVLIILIILCIIISIILWAFRYEINLSRGKFSANLVKHYLPDDVEVIDITDNDYLQIKKLNYNNPGRDYLYVQSYGNTVAAIRTEYPTIINDHQFYDGKIDIYSFNPETSSFEQTDEIFPQLKKEYTFDESSITGEHYYVKEGRFWSDTLDTRSLGYPVRFFNNYIIADLGANIRPRVIEGLEGITDKKVILKKLKEMDYVFDDLVVYKCKNKKWELYQVINYDLGNDTSIIKVSDDGIGLLIPPDFGQNLAITRNYLLTVDSQGHNKVYIYKKDSNEKFKLHSTFDNAGRFNNFVISPTHYIRTVDHGYEPYVQIINMESSEIEAKLTSPLHPDNVSFGETMAFTDDNLAIIGESLYGRGTFSYPKTESFIGGYPGFVHIYKQNDSGEWKLLQTLTSPLGIHYEQFGIQIATDKNHLLIASQPSDYKHRQTRPGFGYIYEKQEDGTYKLIKVIFGNPSKNSRYSFIFGFRYVNFFHNGILYHGGKGICYIPDVFPEEDR